MTIRKVSVEQNEILHKKSKVITRFDEKLKELAGDLIDTLNAAKDPEGVGLAAPQIGVSQRICVVKRFMREPADSENPTVVTLYLVNPKITSASEVTDVMWEACLSVPDVYGKVERHKQIKVSAQDLEGTEITLKASGFFARVIQHEIDHLDGILFTQKAIGKTISSEEMEKLSERAPGIEEVETA